MLARVGLTLLALASPASAQQSPPGSGPSPSPSPNELNAIGHAMVRLAGTVEARILLYAEIRGGDLLFETRFVTDHDPAIQRAHPSDSELLDAIAAAWRSAHSRMGDGVWRVLVYRLDHGHLSVNLLYAGDYDPNISFDDRYAQELRWLAAR